ncbi:MAG: hypothetical protein JWO06_3705 [Bacteroidota bacterium]|nr:hypothetical protein [Bacteroidota bacterium]
MDNPNSNPENKTAPVIVRRRSKLYFFIGAAAVIIVASIMASSHFSGKKPAPDAKKPQPAFHRDEPTEKQIFQDDYKKKVKEMLDSGNSVREVSKQTKIRKDEVRKIKKDLSPTSPKERS